VRAADDDSDCCLNDDAVIQSTPDNGGTVLLPGTLQPLVTTETYIPFNESSATTTSNATTNCSLPISSPTPSGELYSTNPAVIGGAVGGVLGALLLACILIIFVLLRKRRRLHSDLTSTRNDLDSARQHSRSANEKAALLQQSFTELQHQHQAQQQAQQFGNGLYPPSQAFGGSAGAFGYGGQGHAGLGHGGNGGPAQLGPYAQQHEMAGYGGSPPPFSAGAASEMSTEQPRAELGSGVEEHDVFATPKRKESGSASGKSPSL
jgi:hypothetical protein